MLRAHQHLRHSVAQLSASQLGAGFTMAEQQEPAAPVPLRRAPYGSTSPRCKAQQPPGELLYLPGGWQCCQAAGTGGEHFWEAMLFWQRWWKC